MYIYTPYNVISVLLYMCTCIYNIHVFVRMFVTCVTSRDTALALILHPSPRSRRHRYHVNMLLGKKPPSRACSRQRDMPDPSLVIEGTRTRRPPKHLQDAQPTVNPQLKTKKAKVRLFIHLGNLLTVFSPPGCESRFCEAQGRYH